MRAGQRANEREARRGAGGLRARVATGLVAALLSLGIGVAVLGAVAATATVAAGGLGLAHGACQSVEASLVAGLGVDVPTLRAATTAELRDRVAARQATGALTPTGAHQATERVAAYANCRQVFGAATTPLAAGDVR